MPILHTYTVISRDFDIIINNLDWEDAKRLCANTPGSILLTVKDNYVTAIRKVDYDEHERTEDTHLEKSVLNTPMSHI